MCIHMHMHQCRNGRIGIFAAWQNHNKIHTQPEHKQAHTHTHAETQGTRPDNHMVPNDKGQSGTPASSRQAQARFG